MKICTNPDCPHNSKPQPPTNFYKQSSQKTGLTPRCKTCIKIATSMYSETERGKESARRAAQKYNNTEKAHARKRQWARDHYIPRPKQPRKPRKPLIERFWEKVKKTEECWLWTAGCDGKGYGHISIGPRTAGRMRSHRLSWEIHFGPIPLGLCVLHHCDSPKCVRPDHLFLGTMQHNTQDMLRKGRNRHGPGWRYK